MSKQNKQSSAVSVEAVVDRFLAKYQEAKGAIDFSLPLKDRINLPRLKAAFEDPIIMRNVFSQPDESFYLYGPNGDGIYGAGSRDEVCPSLKGCGTVGCICGNVIINELPQADRTVEAIDKLEDGSTFAYGAAFLGLDEVEAESLFLLIFPESLGFIPGTRAYTRFLKKSVKQWLADRGVTKRW